MNDRSEKEQLEELRAWWAENGRFVIAGVLLGVAAIFGWNQWQARIEKTQIEASNLFEDVMEAVGSGNTEAAEAAANELYANYQRTVYPDQARLAMARLYMDRGRDADAAATLREVVQADDNSEITMVARLRLAKILLYQEKPGEVITLLKDHVEGGFAARYSEVLGDAYAAEGRFAEAEEAYLTALAQNRNSRTIDNNLIRLKINDLPDPNELAATTGEAEPAADEVDVGDADGDGADAPPAAGSGDDADPTTGND